MTVEDCPHCGGTFMCVDCGNRDIPNPLTARVQELEEEMRGKADSLGEGRASPIGERELRKWADRLRLVRTGQST